MIVSSVLVKVFNIFFFLELRNNIRHCDFVHIEKKSEFSLRNIGIKRLFLIDTMHFMNKKTYAVQRLDVRIDAGKF